MPPGECTHRVCPGPVQPLIHAPWLGNMKMRKKNEVKRRKRREKSRVRNNRDKPKDQIVRVTE